MITIPFAILLIPAGLIVLLTVIFLLINIVQLNRFGFFGIAAFLALLLFLVATGIIGMQTLRAAQGVDWSAPLFTFNFGAVPSSFGQ